MSGAAKRLIDLARPAAARLALTVAAGTGASASGIGLMAASAWLIARAADHPPVLHLTVAIVAVRTFALGRAGLRYAERLAGHDAAFRVLASVRVRAYRGLERLAPIGLRRLRSGDLVSRFVSDMDAAMDLFTRVIVVYLVAAVTGGAAVVFLSALLPGAGAVLLLGLLSVVVVAPAIQAAVARRADRRSAPLRGELAAEVVELLHGAPELVAYAAGGQRLASIAETDRRLRRSAATSSASIGLTTGLVTLLGGVCVWAALALGTVAVGDGGLDGVLLAVVVLTPMAVFDAVSGLPAAAAQLGAARAALRRVFAIVDASPPVLESAASSPLPPPPYHFRLDRVSARWSPQDHDAVTDVSLDLPPGRHVALVGPSGCGKTTIAALLVRFLDPVCGAVTLNGCDVRTLSTSDLRGVVTLMAEDAHVFDTTIEENLRIGRPDATVEQLRAALARAGLLEWVDRLPDGLGTVVGERGARLSGGQRRRLVLARALLTDAALLILDEPTEHLDDDGAEAITRDLLSAAKGRTVLLITHRQHGMDGVDEVIRLPAPTARPGPDRTIDATLAPRPELVGHRALASG